MNFLEVKGMRGGYESGLQYIQELRTCKYKLINTVPKRVMIYPKGDNVKILN